jgi:hypothetical protein
LQTRPAGTAAPEPASRRGTHYEAQVLRQTIEADDRGLTALGELPPDKLRCCGNGRGRQRGRRDNRGGAQDVGGVASARATA